jgi:cytochrome b
MKATLVPDYGFYVLILVIVVRIITVVATELLEGGSLVSAVFTGIKVLDQTPVVKEYTD